MVEVGGDVFGVVEEVCPAEGSAAESVLPGVGGFNVAAVREDTPLGLFCNAIAVVVGALAGEGKAHGPVNENRVGAAHNLVEDAELGGARRGDGYPLVCVEGGVVNTYADSGGVGGNVVGAAEP